MDFEDILNKWEKQKKRSEKGKKMDHWLDIYPPGTEAGQEKNTCSRAAYPQNSTAPGRRRLKNLAPQSVLDLHGANVREAEERCKDFLRESRRKGLKKVLIIHGKGHNSPNGPVLGKSVRRFLEQSTMAGEWSCLGYPSLTLSVDNSSPCKIVRGESNFYLVAGNYSDIVFPHFPGKVGENEMPIL